MSARVGPLARRAFLAAVVAQTVIVVTGGLVRLTGSGLGCPTWPQCAPGHYIPVAHQAQGWHKLVEFGNRMLTFVLVVVVALVLVTAVRERMRGRRGLLPLAVVGVLGVVAQAVLGGVTVLTGLNPYSVAGHFLLSMVLIAAAVVLLDRADQPDGTVRWAVPREVQLLGRGLVALAALVLVLGTVVTGSGPHSGDAAHEARFGLDPRSVSWLHADAVIGFVGLTVALLIATRLCGAGERAQRRAATLLGVTLGQGAIGYTQYFTGLPVLLVGLHMLGACLVWISTLRAVLALRTREAVPAPPAPSGAVRVLPQPDPTTAGTTAAMASANVETAPST